MITDRESAQSIRDSWNGVVALRGTVQRAVLWSFASGGFPSPALADAAYNLPFMHAYAVLADALESLARQDGTTYKGRELGRLLDASRTALEWIDFDLVDEGRRRRNAVAHRGELLPRGECWKYIDAIGAELTRWGLIERSGDGSTE